MKELKTIQKRNKLNTVVVLDEPNQLNGGNHIYGIIISRPELPHEKDQQPYWMQHNIHFQDGGKHEKYSTQGILDVDLLEIVRHRLQGFQTGLFACPENENALKHIEEALLWLNKRVEDRAESGILGQNKV
jgi:hypothetical protein